MNLKITSSIFAPPIENDESLKALLKKSSGIAPEKVPVQSLYWNADHYRLGSSTVFGKLSVEQQHQTLETLNHWSLSLVYFIEKYGLNYGAKMILLSETTEEKSLYTLFGADEVKHRLMIEPFIQRTVANELDLHPLLSSLNLCLEQGEKEAMIFTIQVVLEGFGLSHYGALRDSCQSLALKQVFSDILAEEVLHHGMGVALMQKIDLSRRAKEQISDLTALFVRSLIEAEWVMKAVGQSCGGLSEEQKKTFLEETRWSEQIQMRVDRIKLLLRKVGYQDLVETLESKGVFRAVSA